MQLSKNCISPSTTPSNAHIIFDETWTEKKINCVKLLSNLPMLLPPCHWKIYLVCLCEWVCLYVKVTMPMKAINQYQLQTKVYKRAIQNAFFCICQHNFFPLLYMMSNPYLQWSIEAIIPLQKVCLLSYVILILVASTIKNLIICNIFKYIFNSIARSSKPNCIQQALLIRWINFTARVNLPQDIKSISVWL